MALILIADDEMYQRTLIRETLSSDPSLEFVEAENGQIALNQARRVAPDVILLDVMMPLLNGFQVCEMLKADPVLKIVPVILVTALGQVIDKVRGLDSGADDFVNKPFEEIELQARVRSALRVKALHDQISQMSALRETLIKMIMHDMGNMVSIVSSALTLYERMPPGSDQAMQFVHDAYEANLLLGGMIDDTLDLGRLEANQMPIRLERIEIVPLLNTLVERFRGAGAMNDVQFDLVVSEDAPPFVSIDQGLLQRVVGNLLTNALKYAPSNSMIRVRYGNGQRESTFEITVSDQGPGIHPADLPTVFDRYAQAQQYAARNERPGRGLGLTFSKMAVEAHRGTISVQSTPGQGSTFIVEIPVG